MDSFFVSVERVLDPALNGKPVIVGGDPKGRGVVSSASYEARAYGVHSGMPAGYAYSLCPKAIFLRGSFEKYGEFSNKIKMIFDDFTPLVEMTSIDEAYLDLSGTEKLFGHPGKVAERIYCRIKNELGLPSSGGLGSSKLISKIASDLAKPCGFLWVLHGNEQVFLSPLSVKKLPGIGEKSYAKLSKIGIKTIGDLASIGENQMGILFGENGKNLFQKSIGFDDSPVKTSHESKSVGREHTFEKDVSSHDVLKSALSYLAEKVGFGLREINTKAKTITLKLRYSDFKTITRAQSLYLPTNDDTEILETAYNLLLKSYNRRVRIRLLGISATNLYNYYEHDFFEEDKIKRRESLYDAIDKIKNIHGFNFINKLQSRIFISKH